MKGKAPLLAAVALLLLSVAAASRSGHRSSHERLHHSLRLRSSTPNNLNMMKWLLERRGREEDKPAYLLIKYRVPPSLHDKFIEMWRCVDKSYRNAGGLTFFQLGKAAKDNVNFYSYTEWDTFRDLADHMETHEIQEFIDFVNDNDILVEAFPLKAAGNTKREFRMHREGEGARAAAQKALERRRSKDFEKEDPRDIPAHVAMHIRVPPSQREEFERTFEDLQDKVVKEEDMNMFYMLRKYVTMNDKYLIRGGWDTLNDFLDHTTSKHFRTLRETAKDCDVEWTANTFRVLYSSEEEDMMPHTHRN